MKRVTIIKRVCWNTSPRGGGYTTESFDVLHDMTDKKLQATLDEMNKPYRSNFWEIVQDFKLNRKTDSRNYMKYCLYCCYDPYCKDSESARIGYKIAKAAAEFISITI